MQTRVIDGFEVALFEDAPEPYIPDVELGKRLGFKRPRAIRQIIKRWQAAGVFRDIRCISRSESANHSSAPHRVARNVPVVQFFLGEADALFVITKSETDLAVQITQQIIDVFIAWRRDQIAQPKTDPAITQRLAAIQEEMRASRLLLAHIAKAVGIPLPQAIAREAKARRRGHHSLEKHPGILMHVEHLFELGHPYSEIIAAVERLFHLRLSRTSLSRYYQRWTVRTGRTLGRIMLLPVR
jgi:hypothetical protein